MSQAQFHHEVMAEMQQMEEAAQGFFKAADAFIKSYKAQETEAQKRERLEREVESGKYDTEYHEFVFERHSPCHEEAIDAAMEGGIYFDDFVDFLMEYEK